MQGTQINKIPQANAADTRGPTWQWKFNNGDNRQVTICVRKAGSTSTHYHKGHDKSKNPERLFLVSGKIKMTFKAKPEPGKELQVVPDDVIIEAGSEIIIAPYVIHKTEVLEDCVILEYRVTHFHPLNPDTYPDAI